MFTKSTWRTINEERALAAVDALTDPAELLRAARKARLHSVRLQAVEHLMKLDLEEDALAAVVRVCGKALKSSLEEKCRRRAAELLLTLYREHKRQDIRAYNGAFIRQERIGHYDTPGHHTDYEDCTINCGNHSDYYNHSDGTSYRDILFDTEQV